METRNQKKISGPERAFKSYYVVWKPPGRLYVVEFDGRFKSYYVVWKPGAIKNTINGQPPFKSYYVVWKLIFFNNKRDKRCDSLNRTM